jgi:uncharacterized membrane protein
MESEPTALVSKKRIWTGRIISGIAVLFLIFDGAIKLMEIAPVVQGARELGYPVSLMPVIGTILLVFVLIYLIPRTAPLGAILLTGDTLVPIYVAALIWGGLYLRDNRVRVLVGPPAP